MEFSTEQKMAIEAPEKQVLVVACAGSGKTRVLTERVKYLLKKGVRPQDIVTITYTNNAAQEMRDRIGNIPGLNISTIHSFAASILARSGVDISRLVNLESDHPDFDKILYEFYKKDYRIPHVKHLLVDEYQDISEGEYSFFFNIVKADNFFAVGDYYQSIYMFRGASPEFFVRLLNDKRTAVYQLTTNYRSCEEIVTYANRFLRDVEDVYSTDVNCERTECGRVVSLNKFSEEKVIKVLRKADNFKDWFVLARANRTLDILEEAFQDAGIPYTRFKQGEKTNEEIKAEMESNKVKLLSVHSSKGLEAKNVILCMTNPYVGKRELATRIESEHIYYVGCTRAKDNLFVMNSAPRNNYREKASVQWGF